MTYEQKKRLVIAVGCLVVCLYDPSMGKFCFNLIVASVVVCFAVCFLCLGVCDVIS